MAACSTSPTVPQRVDWAAAPESELTAAFLGTTTLLFRAGDDAVLIDGFFSRPSFFELIFTGLSPDPERIEDALRAAQVARTDQPPEPGRKIRLRAVFVAHSHHDHAMDSGAVARATGATVVGTQSTRFVAGSVPFEAVREDPPHEFSPFTIEAFKTPHSCPVPLKGDIASPLHGATHVTGYKEGGNHSFLVSHGKRSALVVTSANFTPGKFKGKRVDVVFLSIGKLGKQPPDFIEAFWQETVLATGASTVVLIHWDNFTIGLDQRLEPTPRPLDEVDKAIEQVRRLAGEGIRVIEPRAFQVFPISATAREARSPSHNVRAPC